ncbi:hypothetical protein N7533_006369 [Penicillium manginii]|uniref:uncharacterized protein n=1 Tax=Penicillium manginii TaxID=203109 RepID=UPI0025491CE1|nr:uncharacterized protein N7533_006369 [Penicillium manginii]KAJ5756826.1 hypothetical protein N7533_006369 [Penicillium manginii]
MTQSGKATAGVLQIPATATQKSTSTKKTPKPPAPRLKLLIRRLPPGLTQVELETSLGDEWKTGAGRVDWLQYKPGKVSKDPAKPSRPSRAYIHLTSNEHVTPLSDRVRQTSFQDARHTSNDPVLLGPPSLEFAPYAKTPSSRVRKDARQGTIDQDPDFIAFLESLTQPIAKPAPVDSIENEEKKEAILTTPLVQYIKDKKASKAKESASSKSKHGRGEKESKQEKVQAKKLLQRPDKEAAATTTSEKKGKGDKASKESSKAAKQATTTTKSGKASAASTPKESTNTTGPERKRERGNVAAAAKILQRDLGLSSASASASASASGGRRRGKGGSTEAGTLKNESSRDSSVPGPGPAAEGSKKETNKSGKNSAKAKDAAKDVAKNKDTETSSRVSEAQTPPPTANTNTSTNNAPAKQAKGAKGKPTVNPAPTATQAFLKHANPSQGVTEPLLEEAFGVFGSVTRVEIDKKKGFGYVDFAEPEGLQKAMAASPVTVGQSQVVVLERKANPGGGEKTRKGRGDGANKKDTSGAKDAGGKDGGGASGGGGSGGSGGNTGSSRGSRGGRGNRNKAKGEAKGEGKPAEKSAKPSE